MTRHETIEVTREGHLTWLVLNRPDALNALSTRLVDELREFFAGLSRDRETRVVVVRGRGRAFCAGLDLKEDRSDLRNAGVTGSLRNQRHIAELALLMRHAPQPIIAAVHGAAAGGGCANALAADVRIAADTARMNAAFIRLGLSACDVGVSYFLPRGVGASVASELLLTGDFIDAQRALATGLVSRVVAEGELESAAREMAGRMLRNSPLALRLTKECLAVNVDAGSLEAAIALEDRNQVIAASSRDFREGVAAFLGKRPANFEDA